MHFLYVLVISDLSFKKKKNVDSHGVESSEHYLSHTLNLIRAKCLHAQVIIGGMRTTWSLASNSTKFLGNNYFKIKTIFGHTQHRASCKWWAESAVDLSTLFSPENCFIYVKLIRRHCYVSQVHCNVLVTWHLAWLSCYSYFEIATSKMINHSSQIA